MFNVWQDFFQNLAQNQFRPWPVFCFYGQLLDYQTRLRATGGRSEVSVQRGFLPLLHRLAEERVGRGGRFKAAHFPLTAGLGGEGLENVVAARLFRELRRVTRNQRACVNVARRPCVEV
jgi:hypothetical protein